MQVWQSPQNLQLSSYDAARERAGYGDDEQPAIEDQLTAVRREIDIATLSQTGRLDIYGQELSACKLRRVQTVNPGHGGN